VLSFVEPDLPEGVRDFAVARDMVTAALLLREAIGPDLAPVRVTMKAAPRGATPADPAIFGTRVEGGASANQLVITNAFLDRSLPQANAVTAAMAERLCRQRLEQQKRGLRTGALSSRYRALAAEAAPTSLRAFAELAHVSERTLKRRLNAEGTSFRTLSANGRQAMAEALLADDALSISAIAERLGFSDLSSFSQAFKRWTGLAPSAFRRRIRHASGDQPIG
jgi:AraC-like DNA-binding protein